MSLVLNNRALEIRLRSSRSAGQHVTTKLQGSSIQLFSKYPETTYLKGVLLTILKDIEEMLGLIG